MQVQMLTRLLKMYDIAAEIKLHANGTCELITGNTTYVFNSIRDLIDYLSDIMAGE